MAKDTRICPHCGEQFTPKKLRQVCCSKSCSSPYRRTVLVGHRFGRLVVIKQNRPKFWECLCDCGEVTEAMVDRLKNGATRSCGCGMRENRALASKRFRTHGDFGSHEYRSWAGMIQRCTNPRNPSFHHYGGRGIGIDPRWRAYETFLQDMGRAPSAIHSIDRIKVNGNYEPGNCRWALPVTQANNMRTNVVLVWNGRTQTVAEWARSLGISAQTIRSRLRLGWPVERILTELPHATGR